jgi:cell wall-associated NlpC family hydrolase
MDTETRERILAEANTWLGTPFHHKGLVKGVGVDCGGFLYSVYGKFFQLPPFPSYYAEDWTLHRNEEIYLNWISPYVREVTSPVKAGVALFKVGRCYGHGAIYVGSNYFIHAWGRTGSGCVQKSHLNFFNHRGIPLEVKHFDLRV